MRRNTAIWLAVVAVALAVLMNITLSADWRPLTFERGVGGFIFELVAGGLLFGVRVAASFAILALGWAIIIGIRHLLLRRPRG